MTRSMRCCKYRGAELYHARPASNHRSSPVSQFSFAASFVDADNSTRFTSFATYLLHNPSFDWTISTSSLKLTALGTIFNGVSMSKTVTLKAFNGLPGVTISNFQLPSDDPAGGITISTDSIIPSPARSHSPFCYSFLVFLISPHRTWH